MDHRALAAPKGSLARCANVVGFGPAGGSSPVMTSQEVRQFNTRFPSGLSSENVGTSISKRSPVSLTIW